MSDDLVKRLRTEPNWMREDYPQSEAADRIEAQAAEITLLRARIAALEAALRNIEADCCSDCPPSHGAIKYACRDALGGGKDE